MACGSHRLRRNSHGGSSDRRVILTERSEVGSESRRSRRSLSRGPLPTPRARTLPSLPSLPSSVWVDQGLVRKDDRHLSRALTRPLSAEEREAVKRKARPTRTRISAAVRAGAHEAHRRIWHDHDTYDPRPTALHHPGRMT